MWVMLAMIWVPWVAFALWLTRQVGLGRSINVEPDAAELARRSYAKGDVNRERFLEMMADLAGGAATGGRPGPA